MCYFCYQVDITFRTRKLERVFNSEKELVKAYGRQCAKKLKIRMAVLKNATRLSDVPTGPPERCHELKGDRSGEYAVDLVHPFRLIFSPVLQVGSKAHTKSLSMVSAIVIVDVEDYH